MVENVFGVYGYDKVVFVFIWYDINCIGIWDCIELDSKWIKVFRCFLN